MPYAKIDVGFIRQHLAAVPEKHRAAAIALYTQLLLTSAELLLDGTLPAAVVLAGAHEIGISRGRYGRSEVQKLGTSLAAAGVVEVQKNDTWHLIHWADHHHSRDYVDGARKRDADRKREARGQLTLGDETPAFHKQRPPNVRTGHASDSRAHARRRATSESKDHSSSTGSRHEPPDDDDGALRANLERLGVNDQALLTAAAQDAERAAAWIDHAHEHADRNPAGYWRTNFIAGAWPPTANGKPQTDPAERRQRFLTTSGYLLPDDELEYQLRNTYAATDDDVIEALDHAADLRRATTASVST